MKPRDQAKAILKKRGRSLKRAKRWDHLSRRMIGVSSAVDLLVDYIPAKAPAREELFRYVPIALVACLESYFRDAIRDVVDAGSPFVERVSALKELQMTTASFLAVHTKKVSFGDVVAHSLALSSLDHIHQHLTILSDSDFLARYKAFNIEFIDESGKTVPQRRPASETLGIVKQTFEFRHAYCHEYAVNYCLSAPDIERIYYNVTLFLLASEQLIKTILGEKR